MAASSRYAPLTTHLRESGRQEIPMMFEGIERVIESKLPPSAWKHRAWWSNNPTNSPMTRAWTAAGYESASVDMAAGKLVFRRVVPDQPSPRNGDGDGASVIARIDELRADMRALRAEVVSRIDSIDGRQRAVEVSLGKVDQRFSTIERVVLPCR